MSQQTPPTTQPSAEVDRIEVSYTDTQQQFIDEVRQELGLVTDKELKEDQ